MKHVVAALMIGIAAIHFLPLVGVFGGDRLTRLYGVAITDANLEMLMRHRAVLFGVLGALLVAGALHRPLRVAALLAGYASVLSFLVLAWGVGDRTAAIDRVVAADWIALALLTVATLLSFADRRRHGIRYLA